MSAKTCIYCKVKGVNPPARLLCDGCAKKIAASTWYAKKEQGR
jgi:hypothetical protein